MTQFKDKISSYTKSRIRNVLLRDFRNSPVVKTLLPLQGVWVRFLVGELGSQMPHGVAKKFKKISKRSMLLEVR